MKSKILTAVPVWNGEQFIEQTLDSIARQTLRPDRVVVLDGAKIVEIGSPEELRTGQGSFAKLFGVATLTP